MRTRWKYADPGADFPLAWQTRNLDQAPMSDAMMTVLAGINTDAVTIYHKDGSKHIYTAIEYQCEYCGSYDHGNGDCLCPTCLDWENRAPEDRPKECPDCGSEWG